MASQASMCQDAVGTWRGFPGLGAPWSRGSCLAAQSPEKQDEEHGGMSRVSPTPLLPFRGWQRGQRRQQHPPCVEATSSVRCSPAS